MRLAENLDAVRASAEALRPRIEQLFRELWEAAELPGLEYKSAAALAQFLEENGFTVDRAAGGVPTAFVARRRFGVGPRIAFLAEYDALPDLANEAVPCRTPRADRAGHACGHNHIGPANSGAAVIAAARAVALGLSGEISVIGCPAEEILWGKLALLERNVFAGIDAILTSHGDYQNGALSRACLSVVSGELVFDGEAGHGGRARGCNALDAAEIVARQAARLRDEAYPGVILGHVLRKAGTMPSITPDSVRLWFTSRHLDYETAKSFYEAVTNLALQAARENDLNFRHQPIAGTRGYLPNDVIGQLLAASFEAVGLPQYTDEDIAWLEALARATRPAEPVKLDRTLAFHTEGIDLYGQDDGELSWRVPLGRVNWAYPEQAIIHHWSWTAWSGHPASGRGALMAMQTLALAAIELLSAPALLADAKAELHRRTSGLTLSPPIVGAWRAMTEAPETFWDATWTE